MRGKFLRAPHSSLTDLRGLERFFSGESGKLEITKKRGNLKTTTVYGRGTKARSRKKVMSWVYPRYIARGQVVARAKSVGKEKAVASMKKSMCGGPVVQQRCLSSIHRTK